MMTPRDKKLLSGLVCFLVIIAFLQFLIVPAWNEKNKLKNEQKNLQAEITTMQTTIDEMTNEAKSLSAMKQRLEELNKIFQPENDIEDVDDQLTQMALVLGIQINSFHITEVAAPLQSHSSVKEEEKLQTESNVIQYKITQSIEANLYSTLQVYMDGVLKLQNIQLNDASFSYVQEEEGAKWSASVVLTYYERQE